MAGGLCTLHYFSFVQKCGCQQIIEMVEDGESLDVGVDIGGRSSLSIEEPKEQVSPFSCAETLGIPPVVANPRHLGSPFANPLQS